MVNQGNPHKPCYDISMSRRTRKPPNHKIHPCQSTTQECITDGSFVGREQHTSKEGKKDQREQCISKEEKDDQHQKRTSLKQLIKSHSSLAQHFGEEDKQQNLLVRQHGDGSEGLKFRRMLGHYIKV